MAQCWRWTKESQSLRKEAALQFCGRSLNKRFFLLFYYCYYLSKRGLLISFKLLNVSKNNCYFDSNHKVHSYWIIGKAVPNIKIASKGFTIVFLRRWTLQSKIRVPVSLLSHVKYAAFDLCCVWWAVWFRSHLVQLWTGVWTELCVGSISVWGSKAKMK